jgi:hypothetical protein
MNDRAIMCTRCYGFFEGAHVCSLPALDESQGSERIRLLEEVARTAQEHLDAALEPEPFDVRWAERYQAAALAVRDALATLAAFDQGVRS